LIKKTKLTLIASLLFNVLILTYTVRLVNGLGGIRYLKMKYIQKTDPTAYSILYKDKNSIYHSMPTSDKEILFIGDSLTDYCQWNELFGNPNIKNRGIAGDDISGVINRMDDLLRNKPRKIFLMIGINNLIHQNTADQVLNNYEILIKIIKTKSPHTTLYIESILPTYGKDKYFNDQITLINKSLSDFSIKYNAKYINLYDSFKDNDGQLAKNYSFDGLHMNGVGYHLWKTKIDEDVKE